MGNANFAVLHPHWNLTWKQEKEFIFKYDRHILVLRKDDLITVKSQLTS